VLQTPWRDADPATPPPGAPYAIRMRAPRSGETVIDDRVQGRVVIRNDTLDDMVVLRSDGTPVYMLAVVVDDHDMGVTHVIRGDDHLVNAARQQMVYAAMGWAVPVWAHIPLIHGPDGKKLSKRHGALGVGDYQAMGYPAAGMRNYLTRLGWAHGDMEVFSSQEAMAMFDLGGIGRAPARLDFRKLEHVCGQQMARMDNAALLQELEAFLAATGAAALGGGQRDGLARALPFLKQSAKMFTELMEKARFILLERPLDRDDAAQKSLDSVSRSILQSLTPRLQTVHWTKPDLTAILTGFAADHALGFGKLAQPLRAALAGRTVSPSVYDMMLVLGRDETIARLGDVAS
jgi:glutamyl-tRNA synthetase